MQLASFYDFSLFVFSLGVGKHSISCFPNFNVVICLQDIDPFKTKTHTQHGNIYISMISFTIKEKLIIYIYIYPIIIIRKDGRFLLTR